MIRRLIVLAAGVMGLWPSPVSAQTPLPLWVIEPAQSTLAFEATQQGAAIAGVFKGFAGDIRFDAGRPEQSTATITIDMRTANSQSADRDKALGGADWFDSESFPESSYRVSKFEKLDENQYLARGVLTLRGVEKPLDLPLNITFSRDEAGRNVAKAEGAVSLNRLDFGVGQGAWKDTQAVGNPVKVKVSVTAVRHDAAPQ